MRSNHLLKIQIHNARHIRPVNGLSSHAGAYVFQFSAPIGRYQFLLGLWKEGPLLPPPTYVVVPNPPRQEE